MENNYAGYIIDIGKMEVRQCDMPVIENDTDVLVRIEYTGICGADLEMFVSGEYIVPIEMPKILGHEPAGVVVEVGKAVTSLKAGDKVTLEPGVPCGKCAQCTEGRYNLCSDVIFKGAPPIAGTFQKYVTHPEAWTFKLPENVSVKDGALSEPLAVGMYAAQTANVRTGDTVVIFGAGTIGLCILKACKAAGAAKVICCEVLPYRLKMAKSMGAITLDTSDMTDEEIKKAIHELTEGEMADSVIVAVGVKKLYTLASHLLKPAGTFLVVAIPDDGKMEIDVVSMFFKEINIKVICRYRNIYPATIKALESGLITTDGLITKVYELNDIQEAFDYTLNNKAESIKTLIKL